MGRIIGIDLGTSTSEVAYIKDGKPTVIPNHLGEYITPSVVNISPTGEIVVGLEAKEKKLLEPDCTFMEVKRLIGDNHFLKAHEKEYSPEKISSFILKYLTDCARNFLNEEIDQVVITVPAYFSDRQRRATIEAGKLCGLTVERIINEPTAAALTYGIENMDNCSNILIYDLGGGTLDVTVLELFEGVIEVRASSGNNQLGGKDFDESIIDYLLNTFPKEIQGQIKSDLRAMARLKKEAENCKILLSTENEYTVSLPFLIESKGKALSIQETITRALFEELICEKIKGTREQLNVALKDAKMGLGEIDLVLLVGGSTRIPFVETFITDFFNQKPKHLLDPDLAVVKGAAIQAGIIAEDFSDAELVLTDVCPYTLGVAVLDGPPFMSELIFDPILQRNIVIPVTIEKTYVTAADYQQKIVVEVYQGEYKELERNHFIDKFILEGIPPKKAGKEELAITFSYDVNGILEVGATVVSTGKKATITISIQEADMIEEVDISKWIENSEAKKYKTIIRRAEKILLEEDLEELEDLIRALKESLVRKEPAEILEVLKEDLVDYIMELEDDE